MIRLAVLFAAIPVAFVVALVVHTANAFIVVMAIGLVVSLVLRLTVLR